MRHGALQPLSVTTGLNGRPVGGAGGGMVVGVVTICASGIEAAPALETSPAASTVVAPAKNVLRETISFPFFNVRAIRRYKFACAFAHCALDPLMAACKSVSASQKSRCASIAPFTLTA